MRHVSGGSAPDVTGAAGVLVGFGGTSTKRTRNVLGVEVPMASAVADVAAARRDYLTSPAAGTCT